MTETAKPRILIVDDTPANIRILMETLKAECSVAAAINGETALRIAGSDPVPDLILLDIMMPEMDGYEVCHRLKAHGKTRDIPVIFVTAKTQVEDETRGFSMGAVDYITKPVSPPKVLARVRTHLRLRDALKTLEAQNEALREAARLRQDVENITRHDLKGPLNSIIAIPQLMASDENLTAEQRESLGTIQTAGYRMLGMINLSLDLFKMERGRYPFRPAPVDALKVVRQIIREMAPGARGKQVTFRVLLDGMAATESDRCPVHAEELLCYSMMSNLIKNAVEASPEGEMVSVFLETSEPVRIRIHNLGAVPEAIRDTFFEKYATCGKSGGTGLGTYSARLMAETQGGSIHLETSQALGTTITIHIPRAEKEELPHVSGPFSPDASSARTAFPVLPSLRVLIAEDDEGNRRLFGKILNHADLFLSFAENGKEAVEKYIAGSYDIVLMDMEMPVMSGAEAAVEIRRRERADPEKARPSVLIAVSAHDDEDTRKKCLDGGFTDYLTKPVNRADLLHAFHRHFPVEDKEGSGVDSMPEEGDPAYTVRLDADLADLIPSFLENKRAQLGEIEAAVGQRDMETARRLGHKLKGSFHMYGFEKMAEMGAALEQAAKEGDVAGIRKHVDRLKDHLARVKVTFVEAFAHEPTVHPEQ